MTQRIVIVGASIAGARTARFLRRYGHEGPIALVGDEPHAPYDRPPLSKQLLAGELEPADVALEGDDFLDGLELHLGRRAVRLDVAARTVHLDDGTQVTGDHVVLATGAIPRRLPDQPDLAGIHLLRTLDDALALRDDLGEGRRLVVVGAGFIGMEVAATARGRGAEVTVVEFLDTPLVRGLGPILGEAVADVHRGHGVAFRMGTGVTGFRADGGRVTGVELDDGTTLDADVVVVGIGVVPATDWLDGSGLTLANGVLCDDHLRADGGDGHVWVVGDLARWPSTRLGEHVRVEHWTNANDTAKVVARNLTGTDLVHDPVPYVWSDQYDRKIQVLGRVGEDDDIRVVLGALGDDRWVAVAMRDGIVRAAIGANWPRALLAFKAPIESRADQGEVDALVAQLAAT